MLVQARAGPCLLVTLFFLSAPAADRFFFFFFWRFRRFHQPCCCLGWRHLPSWSLAPCEANDALCTGSSWLAIHGSNHASNEIYLIRLKRKDDYTKGAMLKFFCEALERHPDLQAVLKEVTDRQGRCCCRRRRRGGGCLCMPCHATPRPLVAKFWRTGVVHAVSLV